VEPNLHQRRKLESKMNGIKQKPEKQIISDTYRKDNWGNFSLLDQQGFFGFCFLWVSPHCDKDLNFRRTEVLFLKKKKERKKEILFLFLTNVSLESKPLPIECIW